MIHIRYRHSKKWLYRWPQVRLIFNSNVSYQHVVWLVLHMKLCGREYLSGKTWCKIRCLRRNWTSCKKMGTLLWKSIAGMELVKKCMKSQQYYIMAQSGMTQEGMIFNYRNQCLIKVEDTFICDDGWTV